MATLLPQIAPEDFDDVRGLMASSFPTTLEEWKVHCRAWKQAFSAGNIQYVTIDANTLHHLPESVRPRNLNELLRFVYLGI